MNGISIGVIAPSLPSAGIRREKVLRAIDYLKSSCGCTITLGTSALAQLGYKSSTAQTRATDLRNFLLDPKIDLIIATTGGYNSNEILCYLDLDTLPQNKKLFVGYSDCTALSMALESRRICTTVSGPMLVDFVSYPECFETFFHLLETGTADLCNH
jgi:muramoyltetrapeptide carboxypeptidase